MTSSAIGFLSQDLVESLNRPDEMSLVNLDYIVAHISFGRKKVSDLGPSHHYY